MVWLKNKKDSINKNYPENNPAFIGGGMQEKFYQKINSKTKLSFILAFALFGVVMTFLLRAEVGPVPNFEPISYIGSDLTKLALHTTQPNSSTSAWTLYNGGDAPEGGFQNLGSAPSATVTLPRTLQPGQYYMFVKGLNYDKKVSVMYSIGGGSGTIATNDRDDNGFWTAAIPVPVTTASNQLTIKVNKEEDPTRTFLLTGMVITANSGDVMLRNDELVNLAYPTQMDNSPFVKGNVLPNSSFETGIGNGWGVSGPRNYSRQSLWDNSTAYSGSASLKIPLDKSKFLYSKPDLGYNLQLVSKSITVKPNKKYTLSMWVKTDPGKTTSTNLNLTNTFVPPAGYQPQVRLSSGKTIVTDQWARVSVSGYLLKYPTPEYRISILASSALETNASAGKNLWIDALQLEEGDVSTYAPASALEVGAGRQQPNNLYYEDEAIIMPIRTYNSSAQTQTGTVRYELYDYLNNKVKEGSQAVSVPAGTTNSFNLNLATGKRGSFRLLLWLDNKEGSEDEILMSVVPRPQVEGKDLSSSFGVHSNYTDHQFDALARLGIKWDRELSPASLFRWGLAEPVDNQFFWADSYVDRAAARGIGTLGTLGTNREWPQWADNGGKPNLDKWGEYVHQTATHYKGKVTAWEVWNEPNHEPALTPAFYAQMMKRAADAIEAADPSAQIVGMGGPYSTKYMTDVIAEMNRQFPGWNWRDHFDALSMHMYPAGESEDVSSQASAADFNKNIVEPFGIPVWNDETGAWDNGFYQTDNGPRAQWGRNLVPYRNAYQYTNASPRNVGTVTANIIESLGNGLSKYFYYDSRVQAAPDYTLSHPTLWELDDTIRPKGISIAVFAKLFDHSKGMGPLSNSDAATRAYLFDRKGTGLIALYTVDKSANQITFNLGSGQFKAYDAMGNPMALSGTTVPYGRTPVYIEGQGISLDQMRQAFAGSSITNRTDNTAPKLSFRKAPRGPLTDASPTFSWIGVDEESIPSAATPDVIQYAYRLAGAAGRDSWSAWTATPSVSYANLPNGSYAIEVKVRDQAGNESSASRPVVIGQNTIPSPPTPPTSPPTPVDTTPPDTYITKSPPASSSATTASFEFNSTESNSTFKCQLDSTPSTLCTSPKTYNNLSIGTHTFKVHSIDSAGNVDSTPVISSWAVTSSTIPSAMDSLTTNQTLATSQQLTSSTNSHRLILQPDGNLVLYGANNKALWDSKTFGSPANKLIMQPDGNLVLYGANNKALWDSKTFGSPANKLIMQPDGNLVLYGANNKALWDSKTFGRR